jgi:recombinational DNA repair ATPase RecF
LQAQYARYDALVIRRFYVHNFRCLENFELPISGQPSVLLIGKNGSGKTAVRLALETSHNPEAIRRFSDENTLILYRKNHLEPTRVSPLSKLQIEGDLIGALVRGDVEP